jgi:Putative zinc-finger
MKSRATMCDYLKAAVRDRRPRGVSSCLDDSQIVAFYPRQLDENEAETVRAHLAECPKCLELARDARQFLRLMTGPAEAEVAGIRAKSMNAQSSGRATRWSHGGTS